ncbi:putative radial spoke head protein 4 A [Paratrimastix pyriformis]|uniref:Radial spoke head protein 4 A n=1 Tax=Paratrimastix pyriformis TaxID=342808 RepID=A0ABQ8U6T1_9EUKA|nr:putative radial spoke head protein 4 A [Paratrimastix pyriformis]
MKASLILLFALLDLTLAAQRQPSACVGQCRVSFSVCLKELVEQCKMQCQGGDQAGVQKCIEQCVVQPVEQCLNELGMCGEGCCPGGIHRDRAWLGVWSRSAAERNGSPPSGGLASKEVFEFFLCFLLTHILRSYDLLFSLVLSKFENPAIMSFEESKAFLQSSDGNGVSLYDHLTEVLLRVLEEKPEHPLEAFEDIAREVKLAQKTDQTQSIIDQKVSASFPLSSFVNLNTPSHFGWFFLFLAFQPAALLLDCINAATSTATLSFLKKPPPAEGSDEPAPPANPDGVMRNTLADLAAYAQVGIGLSQDEAFRLVLSMKKLLETNPLKSVRFWGKVTGTEHNYLVVESEFKEGEGKEEPVEPDEPQVEEKPATPPPFRLAGEEAEIEAEAGDEDEAAAAAAAAAAAPAEPAPRDSDEPATPRPQATEEAKEIAKEEREEEHSPNQFTYWVCANAGDPWIRLPEVLPAQILAARLIRYHITGNLDAVVSKGYPFFPGKDAKTAGKERHYLRAQIARISATTILLPKEALQEALQVWLAIRQPLRTPPTSRRRSTRTPSCISRS